MSHGPRRLPHLLALSSTGPPADADLLARFAGTGDAAAFELLVRRHAPMVLAVCRRVLTDANDADDAFQATFLVLARKAGSVARREALAAWLHRVACRAALRVRADRARRTAREEPGAEHVPAPPVDPGLRELERVLDEEVAKLPERHRTAFVLCCLEGKTGEEAARLLGCPPGTLSSRLTRARERLRARLTHRGFAPALAAAALAAVAEEAAASALPALIASTLLAAPDFAPGRGSGAPSTRPAAVAEGVIRTMTANKLKTLSLFFAAALLAVGGVLAATDRDKGGEPDRQLPKANAGGDEKRPDVPVVRLVRPQRGGLERVFAHVGGAEPFERANLFATAPGFVKQVAVDIGDTVKRGQLLAEISAPALVVDERLAALGVEQAKGLLVEAQARLAAAQAETDAAKIVVKQRETELVTARAGAAVRKKQFERTGELVRSKVVDVKLLEEAEQQLRVAEGQTDTAAVAVESAKSDVAIKQSRVRQAEAGVATAKANVEAARLGLEKAALAVDLTKIRSPYDGVVTRRNCAAGDSVRSGEWPDRPLFTVVRADTVRVVVSVSEREVPLIEVGTPADVEFGALPGAGASGKVSRLAFAVEPTKGTMRVEIDVPNAKGKIHPGMSGRVTLKVGKGATDALRVPLGAVVRITRSEREAPHDGVYVYRDGKARFTPVCVSYQDAKEAEIASGLAAGDLVVINPKGLAPGGEVPVEVEKPAPPK